MKEVVSENISTGTVILSHGMILLATTLRVEAGMVEMETETTTASPDVPGWIAISRIRVFLFWAVWRDNRLQRYVYICLSFCFFVLRLAGVKKVTNIFIWV